MELKKIDKDFSVCKIKDLSQVNLKDEFYFIGRTDEELSLVCETGSAPAGTLEREDGWKAFRIQGVLDFSLIGILSKISGILADNHRMTRFMARAEQEGIICSGEDKGSKCTYALLEERVPPMPELRKETLNKRSAYWKRKVMRSLINQTSHTAVMFDAV